MNFFDCFYDPNFVITIALVIVGGVLVAIRFKKRRRKQNEELEIETTN